MKNTEKFIFVMIIIAVAFFSRAAYPSIRALPSLSSASQAQTTGNEPPLLVLPQPATSSLAGTISANSGIASAEASGGGSVPVNTGTTTSLFSQTGTTPAPILPVEASLVADLSSGANISAIHENSRWPTASLTKWMSATLVLDELATSTRITITPQMFAADPQEATLVVGGTYTVEDLLHMALMPSSNVAVEAMADYYGHDRFMQEMNARASAWGMASSYFDDPSGISAANQSTANDLKILAEHVATNYPDILAITRTPQVYITELNSQKKILVKSINNFAGDPDFIGGKTGHTTEADGNLLSIFNYDGHPLLIIVLGTNDRFGDTQKLYTWFKINYR